MATERLTPACSHPDVQKFKPTALKLSKQYVPPPVAAAEHWPDRPSQGSAPWARLE